MYNQNSKLSRRAYHRITSGEELLYVSVISGWEYEQKRRKRPLELGENFEQMLANFVCIRLGFDYDLYRFAETLPLHHHDPFDRMLIAQAIHHDLEFVASDSAIHKYPVKIFW